MVQNPEICLTKSSLFGGTQFHKRAHEVSRNASSELSWCPWFLICDKPLRNAHPPQQVGEARVVAEWIPDGLG